MLLHGSGDLFHLLDLAADCPVIPSPEKWRSLLFALGEEDILQGQFQPVGPAGFEIVVAEPDEIFILMLGQVFGVFEPM